MVPSVEPDLLFASCAPSGDVTYCNDAWRSTFGAPSAPWARLGEDDRKTVTQAVARAAAGTLVTNQVVAVPAATRDEPLPILLHFVPVYQEQDGQPAVHGLTITGEVMAEPDPWITSQTHRHRMEALGRMTMGVAHDLNNLLSGLLGHVELIREEAHGQSLREMDPATLRTSITAIEQAAEDGASLIQKMQRYIRQDTDVHFEPLILSDLIEDCITLTQPYWYNEPRREGIVIEMERTLREVPPIRGSATELREVFVNLILNAVQAMPDGGTIAFETFYDAERGVGVRVADTGKGMTDRVQRRIFDPLFTTKGEQGTGMGLPASYGIVQEHGGTMDVRSVPGEGTTFVLTFPSAETSPPEAEPPASTHSEAPTARVLVVDDEEMVRSIIAQLLSLRSHTVTCVSSGAEALEMLRAASFDLVFTDFGMPEMSGGELARTIRSGWPHLPVVMLTGYTETDDYQDAVDGVVSKPFKLAELEDVIQEHVSAPSVAPESS
jgi:signal transduction histidine kinase/ActR/RegA family two-component response regulator